MASKRRMAVSITDMPRIRGSSSGEGRKGNIKPVSLFHPIGHKQALPLPSPPSPPSQLTSSYQHCDWLGPGAPVATVAGFCHLCPNSKDIFGVPTEVGNNTVCPSLLDVHLQ